jgi:cytochrome c-type biogenesis protein CcmH/NrfG/O-antigen ligase
MTNISSFIPSQKRSVDPLSQRLFAVAKVLLWLGVVSLPFVFLPGSPLLLVNGKVFWMIGIVVCVVILLSLAILRDGQISWRPNPVLLSWWAIAVVGVIAALLAPQSRVSFVGDSFEIHTVAFLLLGGVLMSAMQLYSHTRRGIWAIYSTLFVLAGVISLHHLLRIVFGPETLTLGVLTTPTASLVGSLNDLALFLSLMVLGGLITLIQLKLKVWIRGAVILVILLALTMLMVINFSILWAILGFVSLLLLMYTLTKDRFGTSVRSESRADLLTMFVILAVFAVSAVFIVGGQSISNAVSATTGISYLEVRPSFSATLDIVRSVYGSNALLGAGPNHFHEAWSLYKDQGINETIFWDTSFSAGSGYVPTWFVTGGLLMVLAWLVFFGMVVWTGIQILLRPSEDQSSYFLATISFMAAVFVWGMSFVYVPGPVVLLLGVVAVGLLVASTRPVAVTPSGWTLNMLTNVRTGFVLIAAVMVTIICSIAIGYYAFRTSIALITYAGIFEPTATLTPDKVLNQLVTAYSYHPTDSFLRDVVTYQIGQLRAVMSIENPNPTDQQRFNDIATSALTAANEAVGARNSDPRNWRLRGDVWSMLALLNLDGAVDRARTDYTEAQKRDPQNPYYAVQFATLDLQSNNEAGARANIADAISKKSNYTEALLLLTQIDIAAGNISEAITTTESLVAIDSANPGRYYQLGVLHSANNAVDEAIGAFSIAIELNPQFANARYLRALEYLKQKNATAALEDLRTVRDLNPDNATTVLNLITQVESGDLTTIFASENTGTIEEPAVEPSDVEPSTVDTDSELLTPINSTTEAVTE